MPRINLLQSGMQGVDLKSNPLLLGPKQKLRFATNMIFEEGVFKSRYGFEYRGLCCSGQFQGASGFQPTRGLSYQPHSSAGEGIAIVVAGNLIFNKERLTGNIFKNKGPVNLFQAENYLIVQNLQSSTYWWDGETLTESPGMNAVDFAEIETPVFIAETVIPEAVVVPQDLDYRTVFTIIDDNNVSLIPNVTWSVFSNGTLIYSGTGTSNGTFSIIQGIPGTYTLIVSKLDYLDYIASFTIVQNEYQSITVRMLSEADSNPFMGLTVILRYGGSYDVCGGHVCNSAVFNIFGNGIFIGKANLNNASDGGIRSSEFLLTSEQSQNIAESSEGGSTISFNFVCDTTDPDWVQWAEGIDCHPNLGNLIIRDINGTDLYNGCPAGTSIDIDVNPAP